MTNAKRAHKQFEFFAGQTRPLRCGKCCAKDLYLHHLCYLLGLLVLLPEAHHQKSKQGKGKGDNWKRGIKNVNALHERQMKLLGCGRFCGKDLYLHHLCRLVILLVLLLPEAHHMKSKQAKGKEKIKKGCS